MLSLNNNKSYVSKPLTIFQRIFEKIENTEAYQLSRMIFTNTYFESLQ